MTVIGVMLLLAAAAIPALARAARIVELLQRTSREDPARPAPRDLVLPAPRVPIQEGGDAARSATSSRTGDERP